MSDTRIGVDVHHWAQQGSGLSSSTPLLDVGYALLHASRQKEGWYTVQTTLELIFHPSQSQINAYTLPYPPPRCFSEQNLIHDSSYVLEEWNCVARRHEVFNTEELEEFISTDFGELIVTPSHSTGHHETSYSVVAYNAESYAEPPRKRPRLDAEPTSESTRSYVPEPYFYPYPSKQQFSPPAPTPFFTKASITPIDPHTTASLRELSADPYARYAWIIPVRGTPPWRECSDAQVLDAQLGKLHRSEVINRGHSAKIPWTRDSLLAFWTFLIAFREAGTAGPLSLSLYFAPSPHSQVLFMHTFEAHGQRHSDPQGAAESHGSGARIMLDGLPSIDHIKIYHDAPYTKYIRNVLNAWAYHEDSLSRLSENACDTNEGNMSEMRLKKSRLLRGARLVLVDDRARGVLVC